MTIEEIKSIAAPICARHRVQSLRLFGSAARGEAGAGSDLDFCVSFDELPPSEYARQFFGLLHDLEDAFHSVVVSKRYFIPQYSGPRFRRAGRVKDLPASAGRPSAVPALQSFEI